MIGGTPYDGLSFGGAKDPVMLVDQSYLFNMYDSVGIDIAIFGFGEVDRFGRVNSSYLKTFVGCGGVIDIFHSSKTIIFCGPTSVDGLVLSRNGNGDIEVISPGRRRKFVKNVKQVTIDLSNSLYLDKDIFFVTELGISKFSNGKFSENDIRELFK